MPVAERRQESGTVWLAPPLAVSYNWPDTWPLCRDAKAC
jgi:hypothetical protein